MIRAKGYQDLINSICEDRASYFSEQKLIIIYSLIILKRPRLRRIFPPTKASIMKALESVIQRNPNLIPSMDIVNKDNMDKSYKSALSINAELFKLDKNLAQFEGKDIEPINYFICLKDCCFTISNLYEAIRNINHRIHPIDLVKLMKNIDVVAIKIIEGIGFVKGYIRSRISMSIVRTDQSTKTTRKKRESNKEIILKELLSLCEDATFRDLICTLSLNKLAQLLKQRLTKDPETLYKKKKISKISNETITVILRELKTEGSIPPELAAVFKMLHSK